MQPNWTKFKRLCSPNSIQTVLLYGPHYSRYGLNSLIGHMVGESSPLQYVIRGHKLEITGTFSCWDLVVKHKITANAETGALEMQDRIKKKGPGTVKLQFYHQMKYLMNKKMDNPRAGMLMKVKGKLEQASLFEPRKGEMLDQDHNSTQRSWLLSEPWLKAGVFDSGKMLRYCEEEPLTCAYLEHYREHPYFIISTYGSDFTLGKKDSLKKSFYVTPEIQNKSEIQSFQIQLKKLESTKLKNKIEKLEAKLSSLKVSKKQLVNKVRFGLINWKLKLAKDYMQYYEEKQGNEVLADAETEKFFTKMIFVNFQMIGISMDFAKPGMIRKKGFIALLMLPQTCGLNRNFPAPTQ
ncbi:MAG: hypothetical protein ACYTFY_23265 [Planctomycetota bacterium]